MPAITFLHSGHTLECRASVDKTFDYYTLQLMTRGHLELFYDAQEYSLHDGWLWPAFPGPNIRFHRAMGCTSWEHRYVAFHGTAVNQWKAARLWIEEPQLLPDAALVDVFDELLAYAPRTDSLGARRAANLLERILLSLAEVRAQPSPDEAWLETVLQKLDETDGFAPDYLQLARDSGLSLSTLRRRFKAATGTSLHNYVIQLRIARAKQLLGETDWPLKLIASHLRFSDVYFFSSQFRRMAGVTPAVYRKSRQA